MKLKIKVKVITPGCLPEVSDKGDWIDLMAAETVVLNAPQAGVQYSINGDKYRDVAIPVTHIPLGVAIELPKGFESIIASRSSSPKKKHVFIPSGIGVVDNIYCGDNDEWVYVASSLEKTTIEKWARVCQFRIQLSQKATLWQKLKWLLSSGIEIVEVQSLNNKDRDGLGSTGE